MTRSPAPAANSISVAPGARLTIFCGVRASVSVRPASSMTVIAAAAPATPTPASSAEERSRATHAR